MKKSELPDTKFTSNGNLATTQNLTTNNLRAVLDDMGVTVHFNVMLSRAEYRAAGLAADDDLAQDRLRAVIQDTLLALDINALGRYDELVSNFARAQPYHPMEEWLQGVVWDGVDRVQQLIDSVTTDTELWPVYLENWLIQTVEGVCGWRDRQAKKSLPHVLTLVGAQGLGKSHWLKNLGGRWFKGEAELHLGTSAGKDHQIAALKYPMVELAELDGIFRKADVSHMKAFISREEDELRAPYERRALVRPRMTSFCASVNEPEFLNDDTGSRRFWPVLVEAIDWSVRVDVAQLWGQVYDMWQSESSFNLTAEEDTLRAETALSMHTLVTPEEELIDEYYRVHHGNPRFEDVPMNRTEILKMLHGRHVQFSNRQISSYGKILVSILGKHQTMSGKRRSWLFPYNEFASDRSTWPTKSHLKSV